MVGRREALAEFIKIHAAALCCSWEPETWDSRGDARMGFGAVLGALSTLDYKEAGVASPVNNATRASDCARVCRTAQRCRFFSHDATLRQCTLCSACALTGGFDSTVWAKAPAAPTPARYRFVPKANSMATGRLAAHLSSNYSVALYRAPNRTPPADELRVVYLDLLSAEALKLVIGVGVCQYEAMPPLQPFYSRQDVSASPIDTLWVHQDAPAQPISPNSWAEITHCAVKWTGGFLHGVRPWNAGLAWKHMPFWAYVAPGSGVSVNVGRTLVVESYREATKILTLLFPGQLPLTGLTCEQLEHNASAAPCARPKGREPKDAACSVAGLEWLLPKLAAVTGSRQPFDMRGAVSMAQSLDSLQIVAHKEYYSREPRHELIMLRRRECTALQHDTPGVRCGRAPHLRPCAPDDAALQHMAQCRRFSQPWISRVVRQDLPYDDAQRLRLSRFKAGSPCSSSPCFQGTRAAGGWFCPEADAPA